MDLSPLATYIAYGIIGLTGGVLGGMLGIGGGLIVIPALSIVFGDQGQHEYQAALMIAYIVVSASATVRNIRSGNIRTDCLLGLVPSSLATILIGVWLSNHLEARVLTRLFAVFLLYVLVIELRRIVRAYRGRGRKKVGLAANLRAAIHDESEEERRSRRKVPLTASTFVGAIMGFFSGLLGVGGGAVAVPLQQQVCGLTLKESIATSTTAILGTGLVGALAKCISLHPGLLGDGVPGKFAQALAAEGVSAGGPEALRHALGLAACLTPGALVGGYLGASLTQRIRAFWIRLIFAAFVLASALKMSGIFSG